MDYPVLTRRQHRRELRAIRIGARPTRRQIRAAWKIYCQRARPDLKLGR